MATVHLNIMIPCSPMILYQKKIGAVLKHVCDVPTQPRAFWGPKMTAMLKLRCRRIMLKLVMRIKVIIIIIKIFVIHIIVIIIIILVTNTINVIFIINIVQLSNPMLLSLTSSLISENSLSPLLDPNHYKELVRVLWIDENPPQSYQKVSYCGYRNGC